MAPPTPLKNLAPETPDSDQISPELVPIVTLLSAQTHRRYHEGTCMLYNDLNGDGNPADREWREVYGILTGNQLAYWDAASLARYKNSPEQLLQTSSKPNYLNFTDAVFNAMKVLPAAKMQLENVLIVSTTLKNRYILQFKTYDQLQKWTSALRLAAYEHSSLQEAYTGALLSARGSRLSDIRTILAPKRFAHEDWVKIRHGSGTAWKRCYAVIEPSVVKKKLFSPGKVLLYESENTKKKSLIGVITSASSVSAVYPQSPFFIDKSTIMKLEGSINFKSPSVKNDKKNAAQSQDTSLFLMPESHSAVPGFDTLIRFLIPLYDAFGLYGRPQRLKADRVDPDSLVFGLPTLPHVHYLNQTDLEAFVASPNFLAWDARQWRENIKGVLRSKMAHGYDGCGSTRGFSGAVSSLNSPRLTPGSPRVASDSTTFQAPPQSASMRSVSGPANMKSASTVSGNAVSGNATHAGRGELPSSTLKAAAPSGANRNVNKLEVKTSTDSRESVQLADIYHKYSTIETPSDRFNDRNQILNGSAEEIDEAVLPTLMRQKSLRHGPYPTSDKHLIGSDSDSDDSDEEDEDEDELTEDTRSSGSLVRGTENSGLLAVPRPYENRNSSYSSVHSPLTQYNEFSKQFSKSVDHTSASRSSALQNSSESTSGGSDTEDSDFSDSSPPVAPAHGNYPISPITPVGQAQQLPQIHQLSSLHSAKQHTPQPLTPSSGEKFDTEEIAAPAVSGREQIAVQKSRAQRNLNQSLEQQAEYNKPRYIQSPAAAQNRSPRDFAQSNGQFASLPQKSPPTQKYPPQQSQQQQQYLQQQYAHQSSAGPASFDAQSQAQSHYQQRPSAGQAQTPAQQYQQTQPSQQQYFQQNQQHSQPHRKPPSQQQAGAIQQQHPQAHSRAPAHGVPNQQQYKSQAKPMVSQENIQQHQSNSQHYQGNTHHYQAGAQQYQSMPRNQPANPSQPSSNRPVQAGNSSQNVPLSQHGQYKQQQMAPQQVRPQGHGDHHRQPHPYSSRVVSSEHKQAQAHTQAYPLNRQPMPQQSHVIPPRPQAQAQQSAQSIRSYGEQQYQYQVQPDFQPGSRQQRHHQVPTQRAGEQNADPRAQNSASYMRQY
ncbi:hypothetical protein OXX79_003979 [Metschnikowia pulcherrima]